jgi:hypothetical protein
MKPPWRLQSRPPVIVTDNRGGGLACTRLYAMNKAFCERSPGKAARTALETAVRHVNVIISYSSYVVLYLVTRSVVKELLAGR